MAAKPFLQSFWVHENLLCAGCFPGDRDPSIRDDKLRGLLDCGIRRVLNLMEANEKGRDGRLFEPYLPRLQELATERGFVIQCQNLPLADASVPTSPALKLVLDEIASGLREKIPTYLHCWGGHGRTGTVIACHLIQKGHTAQQAIDMLLRFREDLPRNHHPFEGGQERFVRAWVAGQN